MADKEQVVIEVVADTKPLKQGVGEVEKILGDVNNTLKNAAMSFVSGFSTKVLAGVGKDIVDAVGTVDDIEDKFSETFGNASDVAEKQLQKVADATGHVANDMKGSYGNMYQMLNSFNKAAGKAGKSQQAVLEDTAKYTTMAADAASHMGIEQDAAGASLMKFLKGQLKAGVALGFNVTATDQNAKATELYGKKFSELNNIQKESVMGDIAKQQMDLTGATGSAAANAGDFDRVMQNLNTTWQDFLATVGAPILQGVADVLKNYVAPALQWVVDGLKNGNPLVQTLVGILGGLAVALGIMSVAMSIASTVATIFGVSMTAALWPILIVIAAIAAIIAVTVLLVKNWDKVSAWLKETWDKIKGFAVKAWNGVKDAIIKPIGEAIDKVVGFFTGLWDKISGIINKIGDFFKGIFGKKATATVSIQDETTDSSTQKHAKGGIFTGYSRIGNDVFGEAGHEAVIPLSPKGLRPFAEALRGAGAGGSSVVVQNMYVRNDGDIKRIAYELKKLQDADSRNKGYGYGY